MMNLSQYLKEQKLTQAEFAARLGVHQGTVARLINRDRSPSWEMAARIQSVTDGSVPVAVWAEPVQDGDA
jgi:plasmid maintenance system antidote protein VapI